MRLDVADLSLARGGRTLFSGLSFTLAPGEAAVLSGPNGAGKTSLLRAVAGLLRPSAGAVTFGEAEAEEARERRLHFLGHHDGLKTGRTAAEELGFWTQWLGGSDATRARAQAAFDLAPLLPLEVRRLSAGQRRRLSLARLLCAPRPLWLLDEPLAPLDAARRTAFGEVLRAHLDGGGLLLAAVHDPLPVAARVITLTPFPLDGGRAGDGGAHSAASGARGDVSQASNNPSASTPSPDISPASTPSPDLSPIEGERRQ